MINEIAWWFSFFGVGHVLIPTYVVALFYVYRFEPVNRKRYKIFSPIFGLVFVALFSHLIKIGVGRHRPKFHNTDAWFELTPFSLNWRYHSFPSSHTMLACFIAVVLSAYFPRHKMYFWCVAIMIGTSRIILNDHYVFDVFMGGVIGAAGAKIYLKKYYAKNYRLWVLKRAQKKRPTKNN